MRLRLMIIETRKKFIQRVLEILNKNERRVIERFYLTDEGKSVAEDLMEELGFEKSSIYRLKDSALDKIGEYILMCSCEGDEEYRM